MTTSRRFSLPTLAAIAAGVLAGCSNAGPFTAGRLPYGGTDVAVQDPFTGRTAGDRGPGDAAREAMTAQAPMMAETIWQRPPIATQEPTAPAAFASAAPAGQTHGAAYFEVPADDPFAAVAPTAEYPMQGTVTRVGYETAAVPPQTNPFAEVEGQYAVMPVAPASGTTSQPDAGSWQPRTSAPATEVFLPPQR